MDLDDVPPPHARKEPRHHGPLFLDIQAGDTSSNPPLSEDLKASSRGLHHGLEASGRVLHEGLEASSRALHPGLEASSRGLHPGLEASSRALHPGLEASSHAFHEGLEAWEERRSKLGRLGADELRNWFAERLSVAGEGAVPRELPSACRALLARIGPCPPP